MAKKMGRPKGSERRFWPFEFRKNEEGIWQRRATGEKEWKTLSVEREEVERVLTRRANGDEYTQTIFVNTWFWI